MLDYKEAIKLGAAGPWRSRMAKIASARGACPMTTGRRAVPVFLIALILLFASPALSQDTTRADGGARLEPDAVEQITPPSPVAGGNDPNASDDVLYLLDAIDEENDEIRENEKGIIKPNGLPPGQRSGRKTHFFVNPSARAAAKVALSKRVTVEAFFTGGSGTFRENTLNFGTRATSLSGGVSATADFGVVNGVFAYEHRNAFAEQFGPWRSTGDKVGATFNKTYPFFVSGLTVTPQVLVARDVVNPANASAETVEATAGLTYTVSPQLSLAASAGYGAVFLYGLPGYRHDNGLKAIIGATYKPIDRLVFTVGATTNRTIIYGLPHYRADSALSPAVSARYSIASYLSVSIAANYGRYFSTVTGNSTFKYNLNPSINLTVPL